MKFIGSSLIKENFNINYEKKNILIHCQNDQNIVFLIFLNKLLSSHT